jgi:hypothetical protein
MNQLPKAKVAVQYAMDLRDYFAAKAMQAMVTISCDSADFEEDAIQAYALADEMMKARQQ